MRDAPLLGVYPCEVSLGLGLFTTNPRTPAGFTPGIVYLTFPGENGLSSLTGNPANVSDAIVNAECHDR